MTRSLSVVLGAVLIAVGATFALQGLNVLKGSAMSDHAQWAVIGPVVALVGLALLVFGFRRPPRSP
jgi:drug/metabolite transporter superfamily protein YnfA